MDQCPHCGEPIDENAECCPHCGSDFETGWNPDADYYGLDLPDGEPEAPGRRGSTFGELRLERMVGYALILIAAAVFTTVGAKAHGLTIVPFTLLLVVCLLAFYRWLRSRGS